MHCHFHTNACKGNTRGKATLAGCPFLIAAVYFDYLDVEQAIVQNTIPRIRVWDDKAAERYREVESTMEQIQFKAIESTLFTKEHMDPSTFRGFTLLDATDLPCPGPTIGPTVSFNQERREMPNLSTPTQNIAKADARQFDRTDFESACKISYWYLVVANFRDLKFEVLYLFQDTAIIAEEASVVASNFRNVFKAVHSRSKRVAIHNMPTVVASISNSNNQNDSGVFVLQLLLSHDGNTRFQFKQEHA